MNWAEFFDMGGRGFYLWGSFGVFALGIAAEIALLRLRATRAVDASTASKGESQ